MSNSDYGELYHPWNKKEQWVPFAGGNQLHYPMRNYTRGVWDDENRTWKERPQPIPLDWQLNFVFDDILIYKDYGRGRSAAYFEFQRQSTRTIVTFFMKDFHELIPFMTKGTVGGKFTFTKKGANYGCQRVGD